MHLRTESKIFTSVSQGKIGMTLISNLGKGVGLTSSDYGFLPIKSKTLNKHHASLLVVGGARCSNLSLRATQDD